MNGRQHRIRWTPDAISRLLKCASTDQIKERYPWHSPAYLWRRRSRFRRAQPADTQPARQPNTSASATGAALALPRDEPGAILAGAAVVRRDRSRRGPPTAVLGLGEAEPADFARHLLDQLRARDLTIAGLQRKLSTTSALYGAQIDQALGMTDLVEAMQHTVPALRAVRAPRLPTPLPASEVEPLELVLALGCWHIGQLVRPEATGGMCGYNLAIARERVRFTAERAIRIIKEQMGNQCPRKLSVLCTGDMIKGVINPKEPAEIEVAEQVEIATVLLVEFLRLLCMAIERVEFVMVPGNHGRLTPEKYFTGMATNNFDYLIGKMVQLALSEQPNIGFNISPSFFTVAPVLDIGILVQHGELLQAFDRLDARGLAKAFKMWGAQHEDHGVSFRHIVSGHGHVPKRQFVVGTRELLQVGSLVGGSELSLANFGDATPASQTMFSVGPGGLIDNHWVISSSHIR